ncbi:GNAT family N-acetyltransferase [Listeria costaricensis]|uniref:GNAT family N-acetyltransferase n=1 Tax=Listeria costaricensis TaxID=2026604 RepID=UPI000C07FDCA|nr:GNAT family N-acetyltransferase [Listeria costaricensis]
MKADDQVVFRPACEQDLAEILALFLASKEGLLFSTRKEHLSIQDLASWLETDDQFPFVLTSGEKIVAYGEIWVDEEEQDLELAHLLVAKDERRKGYGKALLTHLLKEAE